MGTQKVERATVSLSDNHGIPAHLPDQSVPWSFAPDLYRQLMVEPGSRVLLGSVDAGYCGEYESYERSLPGMQAELAKLDRLQYLMHAEGKRSLLIVLQGVDASGKDGVIRHILSGLNPAGCRVAAFKQPTPVEQSHDFLWRVHPHVPSRGEVAIFNRSHYEDVLAVRVHQLVPSNVWMQRYGLINDFEKLLSAGNGTTVLKFFLHISKEEQLLRFKRRLDDPWRRWKISEADYQARGYWDDYVVAFEEMLYRTSTWNAPWFVVPSNNKWFRDLAVSKIITRTLEDLDMKFPEPAADLSRIRRQFHAAEATVLASVESESSPQKKQRPAAG
jgi:PPK2 family polyphosphate:nucleotide phosphotransferase